MAQRKKRDDPQAKAAETDRKEAEEEAFDLLDDPEQVGEPSTARHWIYFAVVIVGSLVINLGALVIVSGGK